MNEEIPTQEQQVEAEEQLRAILAHPWVQAAMTADPQPIPTSISFEGQVLEFDNGDKQNAALLTIVDPTGVKTVFLSEPLIQHTIAQLTGILSAFEQKKNGGLIIADKNMERQAKLVADGEKMIRNG